MGVGFLLEAAGLLEATIALLAIVILLGAILGAIIALRLAAMAVLTGAIYLIYKFVVVASNKYLVI
jgi:hypothetical protein